MSAEKAPGGVDSLGQLWLKKGRLPPEQSSRLLIVLTQLRDLNRRHIAKKGRRSPALRISYEFAGDLFELLRQINILL